MFHIYYANTLEIQKELLIQHLNVNPNPNPFEKETILVQSVGMAQWLQMQIAQAQGVAGNFEFPFPTSFLWQQYRTLFPELPRENIFQRSTMVWRLMRLIPTFLNHSAFSSLKYYLTDNINQYKLYQLSEKIADLFDQYLVYRPHWLVNWEQNNLEAVYQEIKNSTTNNVKDLADIEQTIQWQSILWNSLIADIKGDTDELVFNTSHRAYLQQQYFEKLSHLTEKEKAKLPKRIFIFGISALPTTQLAVLNKLSEHCEIHLFFLNPSEIYWGDSVEDRTLEKLALKQKLSEEDVQALIDNQVNSLLSMWGKQGREFLALLTELQADETNVFIPYEKNRLLDQIKNGILVGNNNFEFTYQQGDRSIQIHACHSIMREVEVLHDRLLQMFEENPTLSPKDIIVMSPDIDRYAPYIQAVFSRYKPNQDKRYIPYTLSDQKISQINPIVHSFLQLLTLNESIFSAEQVLALLEVEAIREKFNISVTQLTLLREWIKRVGIRYGLTTEQAEWQNYNSWQNGLNRLLLGNSLKAENGIWQDSLAFDESYGLSATLVGLLANFIQQITHLANYLNEPHLLSDWQHYLHHIVDNFYADNSESSEILFNLHHNIETICDNIQLTRFNEKIESEIVATLCEQALDEQRNSLHFLAGKVNFCTLLPMRAIPFKVVCLLGMNEEDFPRQQTANSFDLMQYAPKKGDRAKRDDDRYLFLEALLSAQDIFYVSYIGQSLTDNKEKLPSTLVSQLGDYLFEHSENAFDKKAFIKSLITHHPMTAFSLNNFNRADYYSYQQEWLATNFATPQKSADFLTPIDNEKAEYIELNNLIAFIQSPLRYFFNRQLGIYFEEYDLSIAEAEHFELSNLESYQLLDELLWEKDPDLFFEKEKLKGSLPASHFADIQQQHLTQKISQMRTVLSGYLESENHQIDITLSLNGLTLNGFIPNCFDDEIVLWRVGGLRDKDLIKVWIYHLLLAVCYPEKSVKFYYRNQENIELFQFNVISEEEAKTQLSRYLSDYAESYRQLKWAVSQDLANYFDRLDDKTNGAEYCQTKLNELLDQEYYADKPYLFRVLNQSQSLDFAQIHQTTCDWFETMQSANPNSKKKG